MTFADGVLRLVRSGARIDLPADVPVREQPADLVDAILAAGDAAPAEADSPSGAALTGMGVDIRNYEAVSVEAAAALLLTEPGLSDLEAAVAMVEAGLASRVVLAGFPSWPGLLWRAYQMADASGVQILPTVVRPGGSVDIVITRDTARNG
jgi:hypothetical protein